MSSMAILLVVAVAVIGYVVAIYNKLVQLRVATSNAWSQISVQLKRRHDLIPNLVEVVKGYAKHESETLENVIKARSGAVSAADSDDIAGQIQAENMLSGALRQLFALSEQYPELKANENFSQLHEELVSTENKIGFARQHYNDTVAVYNTAIEQVPANIVAKFGSFPRKEFFELDASEEAAVREVPRVSF
ncbi:MAG: LemA family protein [Candidatus Dadabacteria bacterium]|nr:MAG: LemA family protein [Candidatus Dadabacteria bacterium]